MRTIRDGDIFFIFILSLSLLFGFVPILIVFLFYIVGLLINWQMDDNEEEFLRKEQLNEMRNRIVKQREQNEIDNSKMTKKNKTWLPGNDKTKK